jgi:hypothetical protein
VVNTTTRGTNTYYQLNHACVQALIGVLAPYTTPHGGLQ